MKFGIEAEYALLRPDGRFADFTNTNYREVQQLLEPLPDYQHAELRVGDAGIRVKNWYIEGDERFNEQGDSIGLAFKGIEIRTPVHATIREAMFSLQSLRATLDTTLHAHGWSYVAIGYNPCTASYDPEYTDWEKAFHASHIENALPEVSTLSYGPDLNISFAADSAEKVIERLRRLTYYSPYIVPFSFSSPFLGGQLWRGLSYRTFRRTGPRPAALAHLSGSPRHPLVKEANPPSQHLRIEFKAFDMVAQDQLLEELFNLVLGIALAPDSELPGQADAADPQLHSLVALNGFADDAVHRKAAEVVRIATKNVRSAGYQCDFPLLTDMLKTRRTPAHSMRDDFARTGCVVLPQ
jgi:hypothetical protein